MTGYPPLIEKPAADHQVLTVREYYKRERETERAGEGGARGREG